MIDQEKSFAQSFLKFLPEKSTTVQLSNIVRTLKVQLNFQHTFKLLENFGIFINMIKEKNPVKVQ